MCVAILTTAGTKLTKDIIDSGWTSNPDGGGFAYVDDNSTLQIKKGFLEPEDFLKEYMGAADKYSDTSPFLVHMRIGTSGGNTENNTHPFKIPSVGDSPEGAMIHNGVLFTPTGSWRGKGEDMYSDTRVVAEALKDILGLEDVLRSKEGIGKAIGKSNKFAFLYANKEYVIVNEESGFWKDGVWFSNNSCGVS